MKSMVREYEVYKHFNGTILIDPCVTDTFHSYEVGDIVLKSTAEPSHYNVLMDFIDGYFEWKNERNAPATPGLFHSVVQLYQLLLCPYVPVSSPEFRSLSQAVWNVPPERPAHWLYPLQFHPVYG